MSVAPGSVADVADRTSFRLAGQTSVRSACRQVTYTRARKCTDVLSNVRSRTVGDSGWKVTTMSAAPVLEDLGVLPPARRTRSERHLRVVRPDETVTDAGRPVRGA